MMHMGHSSMQIFCHSFLDFVMVELFFWVRLFRSKNYGTIPVFDLKMAAGPKDRKKNYAKTMPNYPPHRKAERPKIGIGAECSFYFKIGSPFFTFWETLIYIYKRFQWQELLISLRMM